jgi:carboxyl-terminal processing protease
MRDVTGRCRTAWLTAFALMLTTASFATGQEQTPQGGDHWTGSTEQRIFGLVTVWAEAKYAFPSFDRLPDLDWDRSLQEYVPRVLAADDMESYYLVLMEFAALLRDGHTAVIPPWGFTNPEFDIPPIEVQVIGDGFIIARTGEADEITSQQVHPGLEIVEIDGIPAWTYFQDRVLRYYSRGSKQADEALNMYYVLDGPRDSKVSLRVRDIDEKPREVTLTRRSTDAEGGQFLYRLLQWNPILEAKTLADGILYVRIAHFMDPALEREFLDLVDGLDASAVKGIVIDLRYTLGGQSTIAEKMISSLIDQPVSTAVWKYPHYIAAYRSWGREPVWSDESHLVQPRDGKRYRGPLVLLTGGTTYSTAEDFVLSLRCSGRAVLVGGKTAGSSGNPMRVPLPGGGVFEVATFKAFYPDGREYVGIGIQPDVEIYPTREDIRSGTDPILAKGIEVIRNWEAYRP